MGAQHPSGQRFDRHLQVDSRAIPQTQTRPARRRMKPPFITQAIGFIPNRLQLAGGWIDQPFVSRLNPEPPGSMVVVALEPPSGSWTAPVAPAARGPSPPSCGRASCPPSSRRAGPRTLRGRKPRQRPTLGSQDMIGLVYPGINRLDYDFDAMAVFSQPTSKPQSPAPGALARGPSPPHRRRTPARRLQSAGGKALDPKWIAGLEERVEPFRRHLPDGPRCPRRLLQPNHDLLGKTAAQTVKHPLIKFDLKGMLEVYQKRYPGAMFSGCGGGYLLVASREQVPGSFQVAVRLDAPIP